jgi:DNA-binding MarR family transcriptional regulator
VRDYRNNKIMATKEERNKGIDLQQAFSIIPNQILMDERLDNKSKIIWVYIQGKPKDWDFSADRIAKQLNIGESQTRKYLKELESCGYLERERQNTGRVEYYLYCPPTEKPTGENDMEAEKPYGEKAPRRKSPPADFTGISNKDPIVIKIDSNKELASELAMDQSKDIVSIIDAFRFHFPLAKNYYANKTQRKACIDLIEAYGLEQILLVVKLLPKINATPYMTKTTSPVELVRNYEKIKAALIQQKESSVGKTRQVI